MTETEILALIAQYESAQTTILTLGQSYTITTGGSTRQVTAADLGMIRTALQELRQQLKDEQGTGGIVVNANW